ncbi:hypothetical protein HanRHA438_Chr15g0688951 [Helianthus annuus]|nr:hypothetical protein HanRHA438_Chr15g0688951 [Helianthus annuus]
MEVVNWSLPAVALWKLFVEDWDIRVSVRSANEEGVDDVIERIIRNIMCGFDGPIIMCGFVLNDMGIEELWN